MLSVAARACDDQLYLLCVSKLASSPIRVYPIIVSQVIKINDQPDLLIIEHPFDRLAVVVVGL